MVTGVGVNEPLNPPGPPIAAATTVAPPSVDAAVAADESTTMERATDSEEPPWASRAGDAVGSRTQRFPPPAVAAQSGVPAAAEAPAWTPVSAPIVSASSAILFTSPTGFFVCTECSLPH